MLPAGGQTVFLELFASDWDPDQNGDPLLNAWQANIDATSFSSGTSGALAPKELACANEADPNAFCRAAYGGVCSFTGTACVQDSDCQFAPAESCGGSECSYPIGFGGICAPGFIFTGRSDYIFLSVSDLSAVDLSLEPPRALLRNGSWAVIEIGACSAQNCVLVSGLDEGTRLAPMTEWPS